MIQDGLSIPTIVAPVGVCSQVLVRRLFIQVIHGQGLRFELPNPQLGRAKMWLFSGVWEDRIATVQRVDRGLDRRETLEAQWLGLVATPGLQGEGLESEQADPILSGG